VAQLFVQILLGEPGFTAKRSAFFRFGGVQMVMLEEYDKDPFFMVKFSFIFPVSFR